MSPRFLPRLVRPHPADLRARDPSAENKNTCCFQPLHDRYSRYTTVRPLHAPPNSLQPQRCVRVTKGRLPGHLCGLLWDTEHAWPNYSAGNSSLLGDGKMYFSPPEAARGKFWLFAPFWGEFGPFLTFNNVNNSKHWPTLNNVKEFREHYANIKTQSQR